VTQRVSGPPAASLRIRITGQVQGLGFRPFVYRLARAMGVRGTVANSSAGVLVLAQGPRAREFADRLRREPPPLARVTGFKVERARTASCPDFRIVRSRRGPGRAVDVLPDIATCPDCRRDILRPGDRREGYPFTNCTQCGPRYTIIRSLPYDRPRTTMAGFALCPDCRREYEDPADRRHHAQPNACPACGPKPFLLDRQGRRITEPDPLGRAAAMLAAGRVVAIRGLGGFHLACDATEPAAITRLRRRKRRPHKPFALMVENLAAARRFCRVTATGRDLLLSPAAPIVLLRRRARPSLAVADNVAPDNDRLGVMLASTPLHILVFARLRTRLGRDPVLVMTSANRRDEPLIAEDEELVRTLGRVFDAALSHDRPIANRCDDSVVLDGRPPVLVRRARGWAPTPVRLDPVFHVKHPTLALGGEMRSCFCLAAGNRAWLSPHLGDLSSPEAEAFFRDTLDRYLAWTGVRPTRLACDLHPDYLSTRLAERMSRELSLPLSRVQHHYAHAVAALTEVGSGPALALCFDGTGYGTDGAGWGCEYLMVGSNLKWLRAGHLRYLRLPAAGAVLADPARVAAAYLRQAGAERGRKRGVIGHPPGVPCSSLGRLFDAVAAISGVKRRATFEGEAPVALESAVDRAERAGYRFPVQASGDEQEPVIIEPGPALLAADEDSRRGLPGGRIAARFHNGFCRAAVEAGLLVARRYRLDRAVLTGGSFQNSILRTRIARGLRAGGLFVHHPVLVPLNDGGVSLGQAVAAGRI